MTHLASSTLRLHLVVAGEAADRILGLPHQTIACALCTRTQMPFMQAHHARRCTQRVTMESLQYTARRRTCVALRLRRVMLRMTLGALRGAIYKCKIAGLFSTDVIDVPMAQCLVTSTRM
jgi:hypothetical protein